MTWSTHEATWPRAVLAEAVVRVDEAAAVDGEASAADAPGEVVAQLLEAPDAVVELLAPLRREPLPVRAGRGAPVGQGVERGPDLGQRDAHALRDADERQPAQHLATEAALVAGRAAAGDQPLAL